MKRCPVTGKIMWTRSQAIDARDRIVERKHRTPKARGSVYRCDHCGTWHVTSAKLDEKRKPKAAPIDDLITEIADVRFHVRLPQRAIRPL